MAIQVADFNLKIEHFKEKINARKLIYTFRKFHGLFNL